MSTSFKYFMVGIALMLGVVGLKSTLDSFIERNPEIVTSYNNTVSTSSSPKQKNLETIQSVLEEETKETTVIDPTIDAPTSVITPLAQENLELSYEQLYLKQMTRGQIPYIDQISHILEVTQLPWSLQMAQLQKELETLDPTLPESKSQDNAIGFLQLTKIGYEDVVQGYKDNLWNTQEYCTKLNLNVNRTWEEVMSQWKMNPKDYDLEVYLLQCGAVLQGINRYRFEKRFIGQNIKKETMDNLVILSHILGFSDTMEAYEYSGHSNDYTKICEAARVLGKPISAKYLETIKQYQTPWAEIEKKYGPLNSEVFNQLQF